MKLIIRPTMLTAVLFQRKKKSALGNRQQKLQSDISEFVRNLLLRWVQKRPRSNTFSARIYFYYCLLMILHKQQQQMIDSACQSVSATDRGCGRIPDPGHGEIWRQLGDLHHLRPVGELLEDSQSQRQLLFGVGVGFALLELRGRARQTAFAWEAGRGNSRG